MIDGDQGVPDVALKQAWWDDCLVGRTWFLDFYTQAKHSV
jgi:hypothetical protein